MSKEQLALTVGTILMCLFFLFYRFFEWWHYFNYFLKLIFTLCKIAYTYRSVVFLTLDISGYIYHMNSEVWFSFGLLGKNKRMVLFLFTFGGLWGCTWAQRCQAHVICIFLS